MFASALVSGVDESGYDVPTPSPTPPPAPFNPSGGYAMAKAPHHSGTYQVRARWVTQCAYADQATRCWRCALTLAERRVTHPHATWTAGHLIDGEVGGELRAECSVCNFRNGAYMTNRRNKRTDLTW